MLATMPRRKLDTQPDHWQALGRALATARTLAGLTQDRAAAALGISRNQLLAIEYAERKPTADELRALLQLYHLGAAGEPRPLDELLPQLHPDDLEIVRALAVILHADRQIQQRLDQRRAAQEKKSEN